MRISDWSSDVGSSDLSEGDHLFERLRRAARHRRDDEPRDGAQEQPAPPDAIGEAAGDRHPDRGGEEIARQHPRYRLARSPERRPHGGDGGIGGGRGIGRGWWRVRSWTYGRVSVVAR